MKEFAGLSEQQAKAIQNSRRRVIETIGQNMDLYGVTLSIGHLYGNIFFSREPVTLDEMVDTMGLSKTSISTGMRTLTDLKMVNRVWSKGSRKDLYEAETDWHQSFADFFSVKWRKSVEMNVHALKKSLAEMDRLKAEHPGDEALQAFADADMDKMKHALAYYRWLDRLIDALESGDIYKLIPKDELPADAPRYPMPGGIDTQAMFK